jgi:hypothetical protein
LLVDVLLMSLTPVVDRSCARARADTALWLVVRQRCFLISARLPQQVGVLVKAGDRGLAAPAQQAANLAVDAGTIDDQRFARGVFADGACAALPCQQCFVILPG